MARIASASTSAAAHHYRQHFRPALGAVCSSASPSHHKLFSLLAWSLKSSISCCGTGGCFSFLTCSGQLSGRHLDLADGSLLLLSVLVEACLQLLKDSVAFMLQKQSRDRCCPSPFPLTHSVSCPQNTEQRIAVCFTKSAG